MRSPYFDYLRELEGSDEVVEIDRANAESVKGTVKELKIDAVIVKSKSEVVGAVRLTFVALDDIRGVSRLDHDYDVIG